METPLARLKTVRARILSLLRVRSRIGGLEIGDAALRYAYLAGDTWQLTGLRLPVGLVVNGEVKDHANFVEALTALKARILGPADVHRHVNVVVSLSSINIYSQVFSLPVIEGENLEKAIQLNIQMVSPSDAAQTYSGWQLVGQDQQSVRMEILSAFVNRGVVDGVKQALHDAGFVVYSIESRALSLARAVRSLGAGVLPQESYVLVNLDSNGLEFLVIRRGQLYFQYFNPWRDFEDEQHQISRAMFEGLVTRNLHQVMNFYGSHWGEPAKEILVVAGGLKDDTVRIIQEQFSLPVRELILATPQPVGADWLVAVGSGLRGQIPRREDRDISLLGVSAQEEFRRHQLVDFLRFWRLVVPVALGVLLVAFVGTWFFLTRTARVVQGQLAQMRVGTAQSQEVDVLKARIGRFNQEVAVVRSALESPSLHPILADDVMRVLTTHEIALQRFTLRGAGDPITVVGLAPSQDHIARLKRTLAGSPRFTAVDVPLTEIKAEGQGFSFVITFRLALPNAAANTE